MSIVSYFGDTVLFIGFMRINILQTLLKEAFMQKKNIIVLFVLFFVIIIFKFNYSKFINNPTNALHKYNNMLVIKKIDYTLDISDNIMLIIWKDNNNNIVGSILKKNFFDSWLVVGQGGVVSTNSTELNEFVYSKINFSNDSSPYNNLFLGYVNNINNANIDKITLNSKECNLLYDNNNLIWYLFDEYPETKPDLRIYEHNKLLFPDSI